MTCLLRFVGSQHYPALSHFYSSSSAGVAAAAGELVKDQRYLDAVEEAGCDFVPLVVETFGVWSPHSSNSCYVTRISDSVEHHNTQFSSN